MGQKNNAICDYLEKPDKFADFINGSLYKGRTVIKTEQVKEQQTVYSKENKIRDILRMVYKDDRYLLIGVENQELVHYASRFCPVYHKCRGLPMEFYPKSPKIMGVLLF